ncbi:MAG: hypothetical protein CM15mP49_11350 [Actinomycetota bacterium]|nr:MAG: hypothetical protein CM15mP49_11350 [Actinomycetota bacterium]
MLAVGEIIEPEKTTVEIAEFADDHVPDKGLDRISVICAFKLTD